ncbi:hypothetical protein MMPV_005690 [Pyropia vietnamensis]
MAWPPPESGRWQLPPARLAEATSPSSAMEAAAASRGRPTAGAPPGRLPPFDFGTSPLPGVSAGISPARLGGGSDSAGGTVDVSSTFPSTPRAAGLTAATAAGGPATPSATAAHIVPVRRRNSRVMLECRHCGVLNHIRQLACKSCQTPRPRDKGKKRKGPGTP